jgi:flavin reductase (NADH)
MKEVFIAGMRRIAYPVCILSACVNGKKLAITVSSVTSVSIEPPTLLVCINNASSMAKAVCKESRLNVNFLNATQRTLSDICADKTKADMRFSSNEWLYDSSGTPYIDQCEMVAFCEVDNIVIQSTHTVAFLTVTKANVSQISQSAPLIYHNGSYVNIKGNN